MERSRSSVGRAPDLEVENSKRVHFVETEM